MAWCQRCGYEYENHVKKCAECGNELVSKLWKNQEKIEKTQNSYEEYTALINVANSIEADLIISQLEANHIPSYKGYQSSGSYLNIAAGFNYQGTDIFVPILLLNEAKEIIKEVQINNSEEDNIEEIEAFGVLNSEFNNKRKIRMRVIIFVLFVIPLLLMFLYKLQEWG